MRKLFVISVILFTILFIPNYKYAQQEAKVILNGKEIKSDVSAFIHEGRTMLPVRAIAEALGFTVEYTISAIDESLEVNLIRPDGLEIWANDYLLQSSDGITFMAAQKNEVGLMNKNDRTFLPIRYIANALHLDVNWDQDNWTVYLTTNDNFTTYPLKHQIWIEGNEEPSILQGNYFISYKDGHYRINETNMTPTQYLTELLNMNENYFENETEINFFGNNEFLMDPYRKYVTSLRAS